jgi:hypothetical protein
VGIRQALFGVSVILVQFTTVAKSSIDVNAAKSAEALLVEHSPGWLTELTTRY